MSIQSYGHSPALKNEPQVEGPGKLFGILNNALEHETRKLLMLEEILGGLADRIHGAQPVNSTNGKDVGGPVVPSALYQTDLNMNVLSSVISRLHDIADRLVVLA